MLYVFVLLVSAKHSSPSRGCRWCPLPFRVLVVFSSNPRHADGPREVFGMTYVLYWSLSSPSFRQRKVCLVIVPFLWFVCHRAFSAPPPPHRRYATGFDGRFALF